MPYRLVKGEVALFRPIASGVSGSEPDGDGVWFKPNKPSLLKNFNGRSSQFNGGGFINLRFEGIDALEIHYQGEHQLLPPAKAARDHLLKTLGFTSVTFGASGNQVTGSTPAKVTAHILTRGLDSTTNHRPISFVYKGGNAAQDGSNIFLNVTTANKSLNADLLRQGLVYPLYYDTLPPDIRDHFTGLAIDAFNDGDGIWDGTDTSNEVNTVTKMADLRALAIWPKLYRRLKDYFSKRPTGSIQLFDKALRDGSISGLKDDELAIVSESHVEANANMHDIYEVVATNKIRMKFFPEDLIIKGD